MTSPFKVFENLIRHRTFRSAAELERTGYLTEINASVAEPNSSWAGMNDSVAASAPCFDLIGLS